MSPRVERLWKRANWLRLGAPMRVSPVDAWTFIEPWAWGRFDLDALASMQLDGLDISELP